MKSWVWGLNSDTYEVTRHMLNDQPVHLIDPWMLALALKPSSFETSGCWQVFQQGSLEDPTRVHVPWWDRPWHTLISTHSLSCPLDRHTHCSRDWRWWTQQGWGWRYKWSKAFLCFFSLYIDFRRLNVLVRLGEWILFHFLWVLMGFVIVF